MSSEKIVCRPWKLMIENAYPKNRRVWDLYTLKGEIVASITRGFGSNYIVYSKDRCMGTVSSFKKAKTFVEIHMNVKVLDKRLGNLL